VKSIGYHIMRIDQCLEDASAPPLWVGLVCGFCTDSKQGFHSLHILSVLYSLST
jgi:hypothetical protein